MGQKIQLKDKDGTLQYPVTSTALVVDAEGRTAEQRLQALAGGISQSAADQRYAKKIIEEFDQPLTLVIADGIVGTDDEYYFIPAKAPSTASDSQILATKADINQGGGEIGTSTFATKEELNNLTNEVIANEEVHAAALNDLNERLNNISDSSSEDLVTFYLLGGGAVQDDTTKALNKQAYEAFWAYDEVPMVNILMVVGESNSKNDGFEALCPTAMAGAPNEDLLFIASPYRLTISPDGNVTLEAADIPDEVTIDDAMSDTSENAVQNKVIKQYVDEKVGNIDFSSLATKEEVQNLTNEIIANEEVHAAALNDLNERKADKEYVENALKNIDTSDLATKEEVQNLTNEIIANEEVHAAALVDLNERINNLGGGSAGGLGTLRVWINTLEGDAIINEEKIAENAATYNAIQEGKPTSVVFAVELEDAKCMYNVSLFEPSEGVVFLLHSSRFFDGDAMSELYVLAELYPDGSTEVEIIG